MKEMLERTDKFLRDIYMHPEQTDIYAVTESFLSEMDKGLNGEPSSLAMIPTYVSAGGTAPDNVPVIAIDAGGTNFRVGLVTFEKGYPVTSRLKKSEMPGSRGEVTSDEFFEGIAEKILPLTEFSDTVGFCFSYPVEIFSNLDGRIIILNKEVKVRDAQGIVIGEALSGKLRELGVKKRMHFVILNDTVASLMGGVANLDLLASGGMAGVILGTGCNSCYTESGERIGKLPSAKDMIINCESGNFSGARSGTADDMLDMDSVNPGAFCFEKKMGGVYLGKVISNMAGLAAQEGILSTAFTKVADGPITTPELDDFLRGKANRVAEMCTGNDREMLTMIIDMAFERAARLICANIAALCLHCDGGRSREHPFSVVAEGSLFYNSLLFKEKLNKLLESHITGKLNRYVKICRAENSTLAGAALSALLN